MITTTFAATFFGGGFVELINMHGGLYNVTAEGGSLFLALCWIAVVLSLVRNASFLSQIGFYLVRCETQVVVDDDGAGIRLLESQEAAVPWSNQGKV
jgi:hypothetical protein